MVNENVNASTAVVVLSKSRHCILEITCYWCEFCFLRTSVSASSRFAVSGIVILRAVLDLVCYVMYCYIACWYCYIMYRIYICGCAVLYMRIKHHLESTSTDHIAAFSMVLSLNLLPAALSCSRFQSDIISINFRCIYEDILHVN